MVLSLVLCPKGPKQDLEAYGAEFVIIVFLAKGLHTASTQEGLDCLGFYHSDLEGEHHFQLVVERSFSTPRLNLSSWLFLMIHTFSILSF